jgi:hypothetical protein
MFFILLGAASATELNNVTSTQDSNLISDNEKLSMSDLDKSDLEISSNDFQNESLSQTQENTLESSSQDLQISAKNSTNTAKTSTKLTVNTPHYSKAATVIKVTLKDSKNNVLPNKAISLKYNGKTYKATTSSIGTAYFNLTSMKIGTTLSVTATFKGDKQYLKSTVTKKIKVKSSIVAKNLVEAYGDKKAFSATFFKDNSRLKNATVAFNVNGKTYKIKTDSNGKAKITPNLNPGKYSVKISNLYSKEAVTKTITVNKANVKLTGSDEYSLPKSKVKYSVVLTNNKNVPMKNIKIYFNYNHKQLIGTTDSNGKATVTLPGLSKGTYTIIYQFRESGKYKAFTGSKKVYVKDSTVSLSGSDLKMQYNDGSSYTLTVKDSATKKALANKTVKFTFNGKTTKATTDANGIAKLSIGNLKPGTYAIKATHSTKGKKDYNIHNGKVIITKHNAAITANDLVMKYNDGSTFQATVKDKFGANLNGVEVQFTLNKKITKVTTDANGVAKLPVSENMGEYSVYAQVVGDLYTSSKITKHILVNGTKFIANDISVSPNTQSIFQVKVIDALNKTVKTTVKFTFNNKVQSVQTDSNGIAKYTVPKLTKGTYTITYTDGFATGSSKINVISQVALKDVITASQNVKKYIEGNGELPKTVKVGSTTYSLANYLYLASQAIINLKSNNNGGIDVIQVNDPTNPQKAENLGELYNYLAVAKDIVNLAKKNGVMPNSVSSERGAIGYNGLVYAFARTVAFYGDNSIMPNYVTIKTYAISDSTSSSLNSKNTIKDLKPYLRATTNCQVGNSKIKSLVASITEGLTTDLAKARAIFNYVRDHVSYSFYYDTRYGAVGTLNAGTGNCVDHSHALAAMFRTAGLPTRYVHGTCTFSSGSTYGHVWTQVLIGDTWIVCDASSTRNSFGNVVNWNNNYYSLHGYYASLEF